MHIFEQETDRSPLAPAAYTGWQEAVDGKGFALYTLTEDIEGHPRNSTVGARTLRDLGYRLPVHSKGWKK